MVDLAELKRLAEAANPRGPLVAAMDAEVLDWEADHA